MFELLDFNQRSCKIAQNIEFIKIQFLEVKALREFGGYARIWNRKWNLNRWMLDWKELSDLGLWLVLTTQLRNYIYDAMLV